MRHALDFGNTLRRRMAEVRIGEEVRQLREAKGITLRELARRVDLSPATVSNLEHGRRSTTKLAQIATLLGVTIEHFTEIAGVCPACGGTGFTDDGGGL